MTEQTNQNDLNIQDLAIMKSIIDIASERGTFKPAEMAAVGMVYNKLEFFLKAVEEQQKAAKEAQEATAAAETTSEDTADA